MTKLPPSELTELARSKMARVLGEARAEQLLAAALLELALDGLHTADDLLRFSRVISREGGYAGAVGAMLSVQAAMRGARTT
jgi:hypothetical protein